MAAITRRVALFALPVASLALTRAASASAPEPSRAEEVAEGEIAKRVNEIRAQYLPDVPRILYDPELVRIARVRSRSLAEGAPFAHEDRPGHIPAFEMIEKHFGPYGTMAENIYVAGRGTRAFDAIAFAKQTVEDWMSSRDHRENILLPDFATTGIGVAVIRDRAYATQIFRGP
jgi:uncharacterized protein YkwD